MGSWTLRPQATGGIRGPFSAADRAAQYVRRHGWQFHGAGAGEAVRDLAALTETLATPGFLVSAGRAFEETMHGLPVVGWRGGLPSRFYCVQHRPLGCVPVTAAHVTASTDCYECGAGLLGSDTVPVCLCTHPRSTHNVNGLCIALPGVLGCGCLGWSEARS